MAVYNTGDIFVTVIILLLALLFLLMLVLLLRKIISKPKNECEKLDKLIEQNEEIIKLLKNMQ